MAKSRCDRCGRRIGPNRYSLGFCRRCETLFDVFEGFATVMVITAIVSHPRTAEWLGEQSELFRTAMQNVTNPDENGAAPT